MSLDRTSLKKARAALDCALARSAKAPSDEALRDACIQRFECTFELCGTMLKRPLEMDLPDATELDTMSDRALICFGSRAHGPAKPFSDLDLVVMGEQGVPDSVRSAVLEAFDESNLPFRVDLVVWAEAPASLRDTIARTSVPLVMSSAKERAHV
jgi:predicted nucleotidyltransferase